MTKLSLQFHADRDEILAAVRRWAEQSGLTVVEESFSPVYQVRLADRAGIRDDADFPLSRISLSTRPVDLRVSSSLAYLRGNPDVLTITLGEQSGQVLRESALAAMTDDAESLAVWKRLRNDLRKTLRKGASVENVMTGAQSRKDAHLYSAGAKKLADGGVNIAGLTDSLRYILD
ncbi:hypothetical protein [Catenulispora pinisilvae]|uniref:hypothetical protein n=1 Tax=Catenulispora pinisilvae TaxID=2705253 RepID=UPI001890B91E|nr:hypothetical protein [Catenulispora pinisilvae]